MTSELKKVYFVDGTDVVKGAPLFDLDPRQFEAELERANATLAQNEATLTQKDQALTRAKKLREEGTNTKEELENAQADYKVAKATRDLGQANKEIAKLNVEYCHITAADSGRIDRKLIDEGNQATAFQTLLTTIRALDPLYAYFDVDERTVLALRTKMQKKEIRSPRDAQTKLEVGLSNEDGFSMQGVIDYVSNAVDPGTGTLRVRIRMDNPEIEHANHRHLLSPGMFVRVRFWVGEAQPAIVVPEMALVSDQGIRHLFVINADNKVEYRPVKIGLPQGDKRVIKEGITTSDRVIVSGLQRVRPGIEVNPSEWKAKK